MKRYQVRWADSDYGGGDWQVYDTRDGLVVREYPVKRGDLAGDYWKHQRATAMGFADGANWLEDRRVPA